MSQEMLKTVLVTKEASGMSALRGSLKRALGATAGAGAAVPTLEAMGMSQSNPLFWGLVTGAGVLGHDLAGAAGKGYSKHLQKVGCARRDKKILLQKLGKCSKGRKKRAEMIKEGPYREERSLTKEANFLKNLRNIAKQKKLEQALEVGLGTAGVGMGGLGSYGLIHSLAPGSFSRHAILETTPLLGGGMVLGGLAAARAGKSLGRGINYIRNPKAYKARNTLTEALSNLTKTSSLSRAAKGAIVAPLGVMGAAAIAPSHLFGDIGSAIVKAGGGGKLADPTALQKITEVLAGTGSRMAFNPHLSTDTAMLLGTAGISGLGAGAGKLSERYIPVAKKSIMDNPTARKAALAAALFPWSLAIGGGAYLLGKNNSDS